MRSFGEYFTVVVVLATIAINVLNWTRVRRGNPPRSLPVQRPPVVAPARPTVQVTSQVERDR